MAIGVLPALQLGATALSFIGGRDASGRASNRSNQQLALTDAEIARIQSENARNRRLFDPLQERGVNILSRLSQGDRPSQLGGVFSQDFANQEQRTRNSISRQLQSLKGSGTQATGLASDIRRRGELNLLRNKAAFESRGRGNNLRDLLNTGTRGRTQQSLLPALGSRRGVVGDLNQTDQSSFQNDLFSAGLALSTAETAAAHFRDKQATLSGGGSGGTDIFNNNRNFQQ